MKSIDNIRLLNNTYDATCVETAIVNNQLGNYNYLYTLQSDLLSQFRFDFVVDDIKNMYKSNYKILKNRYCIKLFKEFIPSSMRSTFRRSEYYNKLISITDISNSNLFEYNCLVYVDGRVYTDIKIFPTDEFTYLVFDKTLVSSMMYKKITVFLLPNFNIVKSITNSYVLTRGINLQELDYSNYQYINVLTSDDTFGEVVPVITNITSNITTSIPSTMYEKNLYLYNIGFQDLVGSIIISGKTYFELPRRNMPIVAENMIIFKKTGEVLLFQHDITIESLYHNIYKIVGGDSNSEYYILYFYHENISDMINPHTFYDNKFILLDKAGIDIVSDYNSNSVNTLIKEFKPLSITYNIGDFNKSQYDSGEDYKESKLKELISLDSISVVPYLDAQLTHSRKVFLDIINVDLSTRIRINTSKETPDNVINFNKNHYVFVIKKSMLSKHENITLFVDGILTNSHTLTTNDIYVFMYIPCEIVTNISMIELESFKDDLISKEIVISNKEAYVDLSQVEFNFSNKDLLLVDVNGEVVPESDYNILIYYNDTYIPLVDSYNTNLYYNLKIIFTNSMYDDKTISLKIFHQSKKFTQEIRVNDNRGNAIYIDIPITRNKDYFRIYRNGRLVSSSLYDIKYRNNLDSIIGVDVRIDKQVGDVIVVDVTPIDWKEVYRQSIISDNGYVDLSGKIDRPFSLKWYDVYLNGRRLGIGNIDIISPTKIFINNVSSTKELVILETNRDSEYFSIKDIWRTFSDTLWDEYPNLADTLKLMNGIIINTENPVVMGEVAPVSVDMDRFYEFYGKNQSILQPGEEEIPDEIWNHLEDLHPDNVILLDPDIGYNAASILDFMSID